MLQLFQPAPRWKKLSPTERHFREIGDLRLNDDGSISIGAATFSNTRLKEAHFDDHVINFDGKNLSIRGPHRTLRFKYIDHHWHSLDG